MNAHLHIFKWVCNFRILCSLCWWLKKTWVKICLKDHPRMKNGENYLDLFFWFIGKHVKTRKFYLIFFIKRDEKLKNNFLLCESIIQKFLLILNLKTWKKFQVYSRSRLSKLFFTILSSFFLLNNMIST